VRKGAAHAGIPHGCRVARGNGANGKFNPMDVREYVEPRAAGFPVALREWLQDNTPDGVTATVALAGILAVPLVFVAVGLDADRIHAPNEYVDLSWLLRGAETAASLWEESSKLAKAGLR
jgi:acetylornithine deacetylase/succinyl-diaminopimelate desuccinylase-like protein